MALVSPVSSPSALPENPSASRPLSSVPGQGLLWRYRGGSPDVKLEPELISACGGSPLLARLLFNRGITSPAQASAFLSVQTTYKSTPAQQLPEAEAAFNRINKALDEGETILIYGDFDVDGITGTSILYEALSKLISAIPEPEKRSKLSYYVPDRDKEGHGINTAAACRLASSRQPKLIITTDTGTSNFSEISLLKGLGVDVIVTDHHEIPENLPPAVAVVNPQLLEDDSHPFKVLSGAGVAFVLMESLFYQRLPEKEAKQAAETLLDLVSIGLIADMVPLIDENRYLVAKGLPVLASRQRLGIKAILERAGTTPESKITADTVGFTIGPRLNALGRLENATEAVELLTTSDVERAEELAQLLEGLNKKRQKLCDETFLEAEQHLNSTGGISGRKAILLASPTWNPGIIGIVASRLIEKYRLPTILGVVVEAENKIRCSARSIPGFHITQNLEPFADWFLHYGGHAGAAGVAMPFEKWNAFKEAFWARCAQVVTDEMALPTLEVDCALGWNQVNEGLLSLLEQLGPCGMNNPAPCFVLENVTIGAQRMLGESGKHLKLMLQGKNKGEGPLEAYWWGVGEAAKLNPEQSYHIAVTLEKNNYERGTPLRATIKAVQPLGNAVGSFKKAKVESTLPRSPQETPLPERPKANTNGSNTLLDLLEGFPSHQKDWLEGLTWIDHRPREDAGLFLNQLLLPAQSGKAIRVYHEGKAPALPFLEANTLLARPQNNPPALDELIFWDLPPTPKTLAQLVFATKPTVIHWLGAKYSPAQPGATPLALPPEVFLKGVWAGLKTLLTNKPEPVTVPLSLLASRFATSEQAISIALGLLEQQNLLKITVSSNKTDLTLALAQQEPATLTPLSDFDTLLLAQAIEAVSQFRRWCLSANTMRLNALLIVELSSL